jgi:hypothetical protein
MTADDGHDDWTDLGLTDGSARGTRGSGQGRSGAEGKERTRRRVRRRRGRGQTVGRAT